MTEAFTKDPRFLECKTKLVKTMNSKLLDYKHEHPANILQTVSTLLKIFSNIAEHPNEAKYRKIRAKNEKFAACVGANVAAVEFLTYSGWHSRVEDMDKFWMFEKQPDTFEYSVLLEATAILKSAVAEVTKKTEQAAKLSDKKAAAERERSKIMASLRDDQERRSERYEQKNLALRTLQEQREAREIEERRLREEEAAQEEARQLRERLASARQGDVPQQPPVTTSQES